MTSLGLIWVLLPALATILAGTAAGHLPDLAKPAVAMRALAAMAAISAVGAFMIVLTLSTGLIARIDAVERLVEWCPVIPLHHQVSFLLSLPAIGALGVMAQRVRKVISLRRWAVQGTQGRRLLILDTPEPIAYAAHGRPGCVVVSNGILQVLEPKERKVLFAHERAHLDQHHDRYLLVTALSVAVIPFLRPLADKVRLATERCADEAAVVALGGDRETVATAIARAALARSEYATPEESISDHVHSVASFNGGSVLKRVNALLATPSGARSVALGTTMIVATVLFGVAATSLQIHHFAVFAEHLCAT